MDFRLGTKPRAGRGSDSKDAGVDFCSAYDCLNFGSVAFGSGLSACFVDVCFATKFRRLPKVEFRDQDIATPRLALIAITPACMLSEQSADGRLGPIADARVPVEWPPEHWEPHVFELLLTRFAADATE